MKCASQNKSMIAKYAGYSNRAGGNKSCDNNNNNNNSTKMSPPYGRESAPEHAYGAVNYEAEVNQCLEQLVEAVAASSQEQESEDLASEPNQSQNQNDQQQPHFAYKTFRLNEVVLAKTHSSETTTSCSSSSESSEDPDEVYGRDRSGKPNPMMIDCGNQSGRGGRIYYKQISGVKLVGDFCLEKSEFEANKMHVINLAQDYFSIQQDNNSAHQLVRVRFSLHAPEQHCSTIDWFDRSSALVGSIGTSAILDCLVNDKFVIWVVDKAAHERGQLGEKTETSGGKAGDQQQAAVSDGLDLDDIALALNEPVPAQDKLQHICLLIWHCSNADDLRTIETLWMNNIRQLAAAGQTAACPARVPVSKTAKDDDDDDELSLHQIEVKVRDHDQESIEQQVKSSGLFVMLPSGDANEQLAQKGPFQSSASGGAGVDGQQCRRLASQQAITSGSSSSSRLESGSEIDLTTAAAASVGGGKKSAPGVQRACSSSDLLSRDQPVHNGHSLANYYRSMANKVISTGSSGIRNLRGEMSRLNGGRQSLVKSARRLSMALHQLPHSSYSTSSSSDNHQTASNKPRIEATKASATQVPPTIKPRTSVLKSSAAGQQDDNREPQKPQASGSNGLAAGCYSNKRRVDVALAADDTIHSNNRVPRSILKNKSNLVAELAPTKGPQDVELIADKRNRVKPDENNNCLAYDVTDWRQQSINDNDSNDSVDKRCKSNVERSTATVKTTKNPISVKSSLNCRDDGCSDQQRRQHNFDRFKQRASCYDLTQLTLNSSNDYDINDSDNSTGNSNNNGNGGATLARSITQARPQVRLGAASSTGSVASKSRQRRPALLLMKEDDTGAGQHVSYGESSPSKSLDESLDEITPVPSVKTPVTTKSSPIDGLVRARVSASHLKRSASMKIVEKKGDGIEQKQQPQVDRVVVAIGKRSEFDPRSLRQVPAETAKALRSIGGNTNQPPHLGAAQMMKDKIQRRRSLANCLIASEEQLQQFGAGDESKKLALSGRAQVTATARPSPATTSSPREDEDGEADELKAGDGRDQPGAYIGFSNVGAKSKLYPGKSGTLNLLRQSFNQKSLSSMLMFSNRASFRVKSSASASALQPPGECDEFGEPLNEPTAQSRKALQASGPPLPTTTAKKVNNKLADDQICLGSGDRSQEDDHNYRNKRQQQQQQRSCSKVDKVEAIKVAEANLLAAKQLKQQAQKLREQQKRVEQQQASIDSVAFLFYNQQMQKQQQLIHQQQQHLFDPMHLRQQQQQQLFAYHRQHHQHQQMAYLSSAHFMAAQQQQQQQQLVIHQHQQQSALRAPQSIIPPPPIPTVAAASGGGNFSHMYPLSQLQPQAVPIMPPPLHPALSAAINQPMIGGGPIGGDGGKYLYQQQQQHLQQMQVHQQQQYINSHEQQQQQQHFVPMSVNHHSSFNIVYTAAAAPHQPTTQIVSSHHHHKQQQQQQAYQQHQLLNMMNSQIIGEQAVIVGPDGQQQQQQPPQLRSKHSSLGTSVRKTVRSILNNKSPFSSSANQATDCKDKQQQQQQQQDTVMTRNVTRKPLKSALKSTSSSGSSSMVARERELILNSEGSDGDGSSSSDSTVDCSRPMPRKSALKKSILHDEQDQHRHSQQHQQVSPSSSSSLSSSSASDTSLLSLTTSSGSSSAQQESSRKTTLTRGDLERLRKDFIRSDSMATSDGSETEQQQQQHMMMMRAAQSRRSMMEPGQRKNVTFSSKLISIL